MMLSGIRRRTWAKINLNNVEYNFNQIKKHTNNKVCCVVKANAYGHNAVELASIYQKLGADFLAVSNIQEALQLRYNMITLPILILGYTPPECAKELAIHNISQAVYSYEYAEALIEYANIYDVQLNIHIKIDTGMGRIGFTTDESSLDEAVRVCQNPVLNTEGVFTHFSVADEGDEGREYTEKQYHNFIKAVDYLQKRNVNFAIKHCSNSAAIYDYSEFHLDMVRAGIVLYGLSPSRDVKCTIGLKNVMELMSVISHIKIINKGDSISYGRTFTASRQMKIATVPIGYADGLWRNNGEMRYSLKVNDKYAPIIGRVCMDQLMIDVTDIDCTLGDEVLIFGDDDKCSADEIARISNTINYEVVCAVGERVPRIFVRDNVVVGWSDSIYNSSIPNNNCSVKIGVEK